MAKMTKEQYDILIIGGGITGLTTAYQLVRYGYSVAIVEKSERFGGQIKSITKNGFTFETGPNTGITSSSEVLELFDSLASCQMEIANKESERRLILKNGTLHPLPSGVISGLCTPLFRWRDKFGILLEPFKKRGTIPDESVADLVVRRLGQSFLDYAVDPFISGIYAGDPTKLTTRYALPKLYNLEQTYGSFIKGGFSKARDKQTPKLKKDVFSANGGMESLPKAIVEELTTKYNDKFRTYLSAEGATLQPNGKEGYKWDCSFTSKTQHINISAKHVVTTVGSYELEGLLPFVSHEDMNTLSSLKYAGIVEIAIGLNTIKNSDTLSFGALIPSKEQRNVLGILFPSSCFNNRTPKGKELFSIFLGGVKNDKLITLQDSEIETLVRFELSKILKIAIDTEFDLFHIARHKNAIPQYEHNSGDRFATIKKLEGTFDGLHIGGNIVGGIGLPDRIKQGYEMARKINTTI